MACLKPDDIAYGKSWQGSKRAKREWNIDKAQKEPKENWNKNYHMTFWIIFYLKYINALMIT